MGPDTSRKNDELVLHIKAESYPSWNFKFKLDNNSRFLNSTFTHVVFQMYTLNSNTSSLKHYIYIYMSPQLHVHYSLLTKNLFQ